MAKDRIRFIHKKYLVRTVCVCVCIDRREKRNIYPPPGFHDFYTGPIKGSPSADDRMMVSCFFLKPVFQPMQLGFRVSVHKFLIF
jgi:hypothetical protein